MLPEELLTSKDVARVLHLTSRSVGNLARSGKLPCVRLSSRATRFFPKDVAKYIRERTSGTAA